MDWMGIKLRNIARLFVLSFVSRRQLILLSVIANLAGCSSDPDISQLPWVTETEWNKSDVPKQLEIQFHGAASGVIRFGDEGIVMDPFVSNNPLIDVVSFAKLRPDPQLVNAAFPDLSFIKGVVVGHGHYDHLLDAPEIAKRLPESAKVYLSKTSFNQISSAIAKEKIKIVNDRLNKPYDESLWYELTDSNIRIYPVRSEHSPHILSYQLASGEIKHPLTDMPTNALDWKNGINVNFAVQFVGANSSHGEGQSYSLYVQSSSSNAPIGLPPEGMLEALGNFDVLILCAANYDSVDNYPEALLEATKPNHVIIIHWDNFFQPRNFDEPNLIPGLDLADLLARIKAVDADIKVSIPMPDGIVKISK